MAKRRSQPKFRGSSESTSEAAFLRTGAEQLRGLLEEHGFKLQAGDQGTASGGPFAACSFRRGDLEIGLIIRQRDQLGCPNYSEGHGYAGHEDLFWALGREGEARLVSSEFPSYVDRHGGDPFDALLADLKCVVLPALAHSEKEFRRAIARAHRRFQDRLRGRSV